jgi:hypothetical protein
VKTVLLVVVLIMAGSLSVWITRTVWQMVFTEMRRQRVEGRRIPPPWVVVVLSVAGFAVMALIAWLTR